MTRWYFILGLLRDYHGLSYADNKHGWFFDFLANCDPAVKALTKLRLQGSELPEMHISHWEQVQPCGGTRFFRVEQLVRDFFHFKMTSNSIQMPFGAVNPIVNHPQPSTTIPKITINGWYNPPPNGRFIIGLPTFVRWFAVHRTPVSSLIR